MLNQLRESAHGIFAQVLLGLLVISFAIWGIGDIFRSGGGAGAVASVGGTSITYQQYQHMLHKKQDELSERLGSKASLYFDRLGDMVVSNLIQDVMITKETDALGIAVGDDEIREAISSDPHFQDKDGKFDKELYLADLKNAGLAEQAYITDIRKQLATKALGSALSQNIAVPDDMVQTAYKLREEQRTADVLLIPVSAVKQPPAASEKDIKAYYDAHDKQFLAPELRSFSYVEIKPSDIQASISVSEDEIKRVYAERAQEFRKPERRTVDQMIFSDEAEAKKASAALVGGEAFSNVAASAALFNKGKTAMGALSKDQLPAEAADLVFALKQGSATQPLKTDFGWNVFYVSKIEVANDTLDVVRKDISKDIATHQAQETLEKLVTGLEDTLAGGASLPEAAEKTGQKMHTVEAIARDGKTPAGKKPALPADEIFLSTVFATPEKDHSQAVQAADGTTYVVAVDSVQPEHVKPLADVKTQVVASWEKEKKLEQLQTVAQAIAKDLAAGKSLAAAVSAQKLDLSAQPSGKIKRAGATLEGEHGKIPLPRELVRDIFSLKLHQSTNAYPASADTYAVAVVSGVFPAVLPKDSKELDAVREELKDNLAQEIQYYYLNYLYAKYSVTKNEALIHMKDERSE